MKIVAYMMLKTEKLQDLVDSVNEKLPEGWQPHGSMTFVPTYSDNSGKQFVQVMVKYGTEGEQ